MLIVQIDYNDSSKWDNQVTYSEWARRFMHSTCVKWSNSSSPIYAKITLLNHTHTRSTRSAFRIADCSETCWGIRIQNNTAHFKWIILYSIYLFSIVYSNNLQTFKNKAHAYWNVLKLNRPSFHHVLILLMWEKTTQITCFETLKKVPGFDRRQ